MKFLNYLFIAVIASFVAVGCANVEASTEATEMREAAAKSTSAVNYNVNATDSKVLWEGYKSTGTTHHGTINVKTGEIHVENGKLTSGKFIIDMTTIEDHDLEGQYKANLEAHLKGTASGKENDFFNTTEFPTAEFVITDVEEVNNQDGVNTKINGNLTIKGITHNIGFLAQVDVDGNKVKATAPLFTIDRTNWEVMFMAKSIMNDLKNGFINDNIGVSLQIEADQG